jgi:8-oxo-dGTP pyrophosphatase MutT (NUDIX family)
MLTTETAAPMVSRVAPTHLVASLLRHDGNLCLLRRSDAVGSDSGLWQVITGYVPEDAEPLVQALREIEEETGLDAHWLRLSRRVAALNLTGGGRLWKVTPFLFDIDSGDPPPVRLNWEHDAYRWSTPVELERSGASVVPWLAAVCSALGVDRQSA